MTAPFPALPEFPNPPQFPEPREAADTLCDFLYDLFESGVASVIDPMPLAPGQGWREWAQMVLRSSADAAVKAAAAGAVVKTGAEAGVAKADATGATGSEKVVAHRSRPPLLAQLEAAHRRLLLELPTLPRGAEPLPMDPLVALEGARRLYQFCQVLGAPQQEKEALRYSLSSEFRPRHMAGLLSVYATWRYLPMVWEHVRQRLTVSSGATPAMQEAERLIREQLTAWPLPLAGVFGVDFTPDPAALTLIDSQPVGARFLAEQLLQRALSDPDAKLEAWATERAMVAMGGLLGGVAVEPARTRIKQAFGAKGEALVRTWEMWLARGA